MIKKRIKKVTLLLLTAFMMVQLVGCAKSGYTSFEIANFDETKRKTEIQIPNDILMGDGKKALENSNNNTLEISLQKKVFPKGYICWWTHWIWIFLIQVLKNGIRDAWRM